MRVVAVIALLALAGAIAVVAIPNATGDGAVTVYAASSLRQVLPDHDPGARYSFAGSRSLELQIERGAPADVFASAAAAQAQALHAAGRCSRPRAFATNRIVLLVPSANSAGIRSLEDLAAGGRRVAIGARGVPAGDYARELLDRLGLGRVLRRNVVSEEVSVAGITAKVAGGSADAGLAYATDAVAAPDRVEVVELPRAAQPAIVYQACAVQREGADVRRAELWIDGLLGRDGRRALARGGFGAP